MATSAPLKAASTQPATGIGSLAMTNALLAQGAAKNSSPAYDTPVGVAGKIDATGKILSGPMAGQQAGTDVGGSYVPPSSTPITPAVPVPPPTPPAATTSAGTPIPPATTSSTTPVDTSQPNPKTTTVTPASQTTSGSASQTPTQAAHAAAITSGAAVPQDSGTGVSAATTAIGNATANQSYTPQAPVVQALADATDKYTQDFNEAMSSQGQGETLVQQYKDFTSQLGIPALDTELMNMKNIIDGTEDDVRNEVTKAGGFATDSQVLAMTNARNKTMIQNYNTLLQTRSDAQQQVTTMIGLAEQDRQYASQQIDKQLNFDQAQITFQQKAVDNAQSSIQQSIANYGAASVLKQALATGDPTAVARINSIMSASGVPFDLSTAAVAPPTLAEQAQMASIAASRASTAKSSFELNQEENPGPGGVNAVAVQKQNDLQNAADAQTVNSNYESIQSLFPSGTDLSKVTAKDVSKLSAADQTTIGKALSRIQNPDLARGNAGPVDALAAVGLPGQIAEGVGQFLTGKPYDDTKVAQAVNTAAQLVSQRNSTNTPSVPPTTPLKSGATGTLDSGITWKIE